MRWIVVLALIGFSPCAVAQQPFVEIVGVRISTGMTEGDVRALVPSSAIRIVPKAPAVPDTSEMWLVGQERWEDGGTIQFEHGRVVKATRNLRASNHPEVYRLFLLLSESIKRLTAGADYTCAMVMTYAPQRIFPQTETVLVLPDRIIEIGTASRSGDESGSVSIRESLRVNPVPATEKVHAGAGDWGHCVFRE